jgi:hypothetical protein
MRKINSIIGGIILLLGILGLSGIIAHILFQDLKLFGSPDITGPYFALSGFRIDCFTWWGKLIHLIIEIILINVGWRKLTNRK